MKLFDEMHWIYKLVVGGFVIYSALTLIKWLGLGFLQFLQIVTLTVSFGLLFFVGLGLMKQGTVDGLLGAINSSWSWAKDIFIEAIEKAQAEAQPKKNTA